MACGSSCCGPPAVAPPVPSDKEESQPQDDCCERDLRMAENTRKDDCSSQDDCRGDSHVETPAGNALACIDDDCCNATELEEDKQWQMISPQGSGSCQDVPPSKVSEPTEKGDCCTQTRHSEGDEDVRSDKTSAGCEHDCCSDSTPKDQDGLEFGMAENRVPDACCGSESLNDDRCEDSASASAIMQLEHAGDPSCCAGKASPCCDTSCLDRIALRECKKDTVVVEATEQLQGPTISSASHDGDERTPCNKHARATRERYAATLEALGCICRALVALGQGSCCSPRSARTSVRDRPRTRKLNRCTPRMSVDIDRAGGPKSCDDMKDKTTTCVKDCCNESRNPSPIGSFRRLQRADNAPRAASLKSKTRPNDMVDIEQAVSGDEHVVLSISGMTCTGCETKLRRTLGNLESVKNLKTSLLLARAEFDFDPNSGTVEDVMRHLERTTEFKSEKIMNQGSSIDIIPSVDTASFINGAWPPGVTGMAAIDSKTVNVTFDAKVVGARDLLESGWESPQRLAAPRADPTVEAGNKHVRHMGFMTLLSALLTIPVLVLAWAPLPERPITYGSVSLSLATIVQFVVAGPFYPKALKSLIFSRMIEMDLLIVLSTSAAYIFSVVSFGYLVVHHPLSTGEFFETSTLLVTLIMVGRFVSAFAREKAVDSISMRSLQTPLATLVNDVGGQNVEIEASLLQYGDVFRVSPDARIPTDGTVISGSSEVDESMVTGESKPVEKSAKSPIIAGSINGPGTLVARLTRLPSDNTVSAIARLIDEVKLSTPKIQEIADRVASYFVPIVIAITFVTFVIWVAVGVAVRKQSGAEASVQAITYAITVLIVSCPCAIGLAVPMVIVIASGVAAERGVIFKSADGIELAHKASHVVFDKTGTLTEGKLSIATEQYLGEDASATMSLLLGLVQGIKHPVSAAMAAHLLAKGISATSNIEQTVSTGNGVSGSVAGLSLRAGNCRWLGVHSDATVQDILSHGYTVFCFTINNELAAVFGLEDSIRPGASLTISELIRRGISVHIISGDDHGAVESVARQLGVSSNNVRARCSPTQKMTYIQDLLAPPSYHQPDESFKKPVVIFCGDGTNDAVALAQATIGMHMNEGTDVAQSAADVVIMNSRLSSILTAINVSRKAIQRIKFNFGWSFVYNLFAILLGAGAFVNFRIPPQYAGLGELVSVLPVIIAAVLLKWSKF